MIFKSIADTKKKIEHDYNKSLDISFKNIHCNKNELLLVYNQSLCSSDSINDFILKSLGSIVEDEIKIKKNNVISYFTSFLPANSVKEVTNYEEAYDFLGDGFALIFFDELDIALAIEVKEFLARAITNPLTEQSISGPKDAFNEHFMTNIGLIRKRIRTNHLVVSEKKIGKASKTKVAVIYLDNVIEKELLDNVNKKLDAIDIDGILDVSYLKQILQQKKSTFPVVESTERPDTACINLLEGRIIIICDNSPFAIIIPTFFIDLFHASEDNYQSPIHVSVTRFIRFIAFALAILTPAFYIAITTYNQEAIPVNLFISFAEQRSGVPFPALLEALMMTLVFEILRESDVRMPQLSGSSISILGAIVLGDAAVSAGIVSPIMVIVVAISAICSFIFSRISMINVVRWWRVIFMLFAACFGIPGIILCGVLFITKLADIKSFGKPYLYPIAPFSLKFFLVNVFKRSLKKDNMRSPLLTDSNYRRNRL